MQLELGKFYKDRDGNKVGPILAGEQYKEGPWRFKCGSDYFGNKGDSYNRMWKSDYAPFLIEEWRDETKSPIQEEVVTKRKLVPGVYGRLKIENQTGNIMRMSFCGKSGETYGAVVHELSIEELEEASHILAQLAEFLRSEGK